MHRCEQHTGEFIVFVSLSFSLSRSPVYFSSIKLISITIGFGVFVVFLVTVTLLHVPRTLYAHSHVCTYTSSLAHIQFSLSDRLKDGIFVHSFIDTGLLPFNNYHQHRITKDITILFDGDDGTADILYLHIVLCSSLANTKKLNGNFSDFGFSHILNGIFVMCTHTHVRTYVLCIISFSICFCTLWA